ncbi:MAG TPA: glycosyltransferase family 39 protein [Chloroflexia bacterium]|nr:glycosyltransferase family 39 protein [Chloroflexia bacterium]
MQAWKIVTVLLFAYFGLATLYNLAVPVGEAPDEPSHIQYTEIILKTGQLPTIPLGSERYSYEAEQPPLYYLLATGWIRLFWSSDKLAPDLQSNPDFSFANETPYNAYLPNYPPTYTLPVHLLRLFSTLIGLLTLLLTWLSAREIWPDVSDDSGASKLRGGLYAGALAVGFVALLPGFTFTSGTVTNDTLAAATGAGVLFVALRILKRGLNLQMAALAGIVLGLAILSKWSLAVFVPLVLVVCLFSVAKSWPSRIASMAVLLGATVLVGGWPFVSNLLEYGDPLATSARQLAKNEIASPLANMPFFWLDRGYIGGLLDSLWGVFGLRNLELPSLVYLPYYLLLLLGLVLGVFLLRRGEHFERRAIAVCLLVVILIYAGVAWQNSQFWAIQGRLLLPGLAALALVVGRGVDVVLSLLLNSQRRVFIGTLAMLSGLFALNMYAIVARLIPAYWNQ